MTDVDQKSLSHPSVMPFLIYDLKIAIAGEEIESTKKALWTDLSRVHSHALTWVKGSLENISYMSRKKEMK